MLNLVDSVTTKIGQFVALIANKAVIPVEILPDKAILTASTGVLLNTLGTYNLKALGDFSISGEITQFDWNATLGADVELISYLDSAGENGLRIFQRLADNFIVAETLDASSITSSVSWDAHLLSTGVHQIAYSRIAGVSQKLYVDGLLVSSDTDATDSMGVPADITNTIIDISKNTSAEITTSTNHGFSSNYLIKIAGIIGTLDLHGVDTLNGNTYKITSTALNKFTIPINSVNFDSWVSGGTVTYSPPQSFSMLAGSTNVLIVSGVLTAEDVKILYEIVRNNLAVVDQSGTITEVTKA